MKRFLFLLAFGAVFSSTAQQLTLKKGTITDSIKVNDSLPESFALYLPSNFDINKKWPVIFVFDMQGRGKQALSMFAGAAEEEGYILAASNNTQDSLSISKNILISNRMFNMVFSLFPIQKGRSYTAGFSNGARLASLVPTFIKGVQGVISCGSPVANIEVLSPKNPFHFIGLVGNGDYNYPEMLEVEKTLNKFKFPNQILVFEGGHQWPNKEYLVKAMKIFTFAAMAKGNTMKNDSLIKTVYKQNLIEVNTLVNNNKPLLADNLLKKMIDVYRPHMNLDSLKESRKILRKSRLFRTQNRNQNAILFKETLIKEDYEYYLEEDILTYNYNNLGWWNYQMGELKKYDISANVLEQQMGERLHGYINALIEDNIDVIKAEPTIDLEALTFLYMLKTITAPKDYAAYLQVISNSANMEDYGTALFYVEELLKNGYTNKAELYALEDTALLRITPEFNEIVEKYLKEARYGTIEE
ncbi:MAG: alpha/beta hydrolase [Maribacter sp.]|nr:MAG: alpha/beta hydrolase [Maribacter sp.]